MTRSLGDSPAVARQRVRRDLRRARQTTALTQTDVARQLGWSLSKVQRIEAGEVAVSETDLRALLGLYGVVDHQRVGALVASAQLARRERWWTPAEHREFLTPATRQLMQFELVATRIRTYQPIVVPGLLQTPAMAEQVISAWGRHLSAESRQVVFDIRMERRRNILDRPDPPSYSLLLDESAIERQIGGAEVMAEQLENLVEAARRPSIAIRLVPLQKGAFVADLGAFTLLDTDDDPDDSVLYRELFDEDVIEHGLDRTARYREVFEDVWAQAYHEDASLRRITATAARLRASLDRA